jgi:rubredoxin
MGTEMTEKMVPCECLVWGYIYDPEAGDPKAGIPHGVEFDALPDDGVCPECGAGKDQFVNVHEGSG